MSETSMVYLVGAGPGDPDLLTVKALRLLQSAECIVYDRLVSEDILKLIPSGISRIAVGKQVGHHCVPQDEINTLLVRLAESGRKVVRLKGGDPYIFGRGSEEALYLRSKGINFEIIPGITAASACSAYAGIPLTHRGMSRRVNFLTGHFKNDEQLDVAWDKLADPEATLVIYMGLANLEMIASRLISAGLPGDTPAAAIQNGTTRQQQRCLTTLAKLPEDVRESGMQAPVMLVIGQVVSLADELDWFSRQLESSEAVGKLQSLSG